MRLLRDLDVKHYIPATDTSQVCIWPKLDHLSRLYAIPRNYKKELDNERQQLVKPAHQQRELSIPRRASCWGRRGIEMEILYT